MSQPCSFPNPVQTTHSFFKLSCGFFLTAVLATGCAAQKNAPDAYQKNNLPPAPEREFRASWISTVWNGDWPSKRNLSVAQQKAELIALLNQAEKLKLNAVVFQVRPSCDAIYDSKIEPWSEALNGEMGKAPQPFYDPLTFAVEEAHKRGLELHAWFNPYRAKAPIKGHVDPKHVSKTHPEIVRTYGNMLWLDPAEPGTRAYSLSVVMDVVRRYDIDGVHFDDYFYPYQVKDPNDKKRNLEFPDGAAWQRYIRAGGNLSRSDWRREQVNAMVQQVYRAIKAEKPWVKFGISPFGIWQPGHPAQIRGLNSYESLYCDSRKWFSNGWVDYLTPQLYWTIDAKAQSFPVLLKWWAEQNAAGRHLWPGLSVGKKSNEEFANEILVTRKQAGSSGTVLWHQRALGREKLDELTKINAKPALVPASPWLSRTVPQKPTLHGVKNGSQLKLNWNPAKEGQVWLWVVQKKTGGQWSTEILPGEDTTHTIKPDESSRLPDVVAVSAVDRYSNASAPAIFVND